MLGHAQAALSVPPLPLDLRSERRCLSGIRAGELLHYMAGLHANPIDPDLPHRSASDYPFARTTYERFLVANKVAVNPAAALPPQAGIPRMNRLRMDPSRLPS